MEAEKADLLALRNELSVQVAAKDEELQKLQGTYQELESKMKEEIAKGDIRLSQAGGRIKVDLVDRILFEVGDASVTERGAEVLSRVGAVLANVEDKKIQVSGHTDDLPISERLRDRYPTNWELAAARASNVVRFLEEKANVPGRRLVAAAYGPWEPISSNRTATRPRAEPAHRDRAHPAARARADRRRGRGGEGPRQDPGGRDQEGGREAGGEEKAPLTPGRVEERGKPASPRRERGDGSGQDANSPSPRAAGRGSGRGVVGVRTRRRSCLASRRSTVREKEKAPSA